MKRITTAFCIGVAIIWSGKLAGADCPPLVLEQATILDLQAAFDCGDLTSEELVRIYLARIAAYDRQGPTLKAILATNPNALETARALDRERAESGPRGPLHGIPLLLKDNYDTFDMPTTGGSVLFEGSIPPDDGFQTRRLREAGAIILGKTNLYEFARFGPGSSMGGLTRNPYHLLRSIGGSSSGTAAAVAAHFAVAGTGTDTGGSIRVPSAWGSLVGLKPTLGLTSSDGIMPSNLTRDVGGPMARSVTDVAVLLDVLAGVDPADLATQAAAGQLPASYTDVLDGEGLRGARIGVFREFALVGGAEGSIASLVNAAIADLEAAGAEIVDPAPTAALFALYLENRGTLFGYRSFEYDLNRYLESRGPQAPVQSVQEIVATGTVVGANWNNLRGDVPRDEDPGYPEILALEEALQSAVLEVMDSENLDVLLYTTASRPPMSFGEDYTFVPNTLLASFTRLPAIVVPGGFTSERLPVGIELMGRPFSEPTLIRIAYAYEQATGHRAAPASTPVIDCNDNALPDALDVARGTSTDCNQDGTLDECDPDCNQNGLSDPCEILDGLSPDCNGNLQPDACEVAFEAFGECPHLLGADVGRVGDLGSPGSSRSEEDCLQVIGTAGNLSVTKDVFHFAHQQVQGNFRLTARIEDWRVDLQSSKLGVMVRESLDPHSRHGAVIIEKTNSGFRHRFLRREKTGSRTTSSRHETYEHPAVWLRIDRRGSTISGQLSLDGTTWTEPDTVELAELGSEVHVGVASSYITPTAGGEPSLARVCDLALEALPVGPAPTFLRGDCNDDGEIDVSDARCILTWQFLGASAPGCLTATNTNGDRGIDIADAIYLLGSLFLGGPALAQPFPECGPGTQSDAALGCRASGCK